MTEDVRCFIDRADARSRSDRTARRVCSAHKLVRAFGRVPVTARSSEIDILVRNSVDVRRRGIAGKLNPSMLLLVLASATMTVPVPAPARKLTPLTDGLALGFDFGTSGVRCAVVNAAGEIVASPASYGWGKKERCQEASDWVAALHAQLDALPK